MLVIEYDALYGMSCPDGYAEILARGFQCIETAHPTKPIYKTSNWLVIQWCRYIHKEKFVLIIGNNTYRMQENLQFDTQPHSDGFEDPYWIILEKITQSYVRDSLCIELNNGYKYFYTPGKSIYSFEYPVEITWLAEIPPYEE
jgi:hypothetical protein